MSTPSSPLSSAAPPGARPVILHADMDAFYVGVELRRYPELVGQPVVVGGTGSRGVVAAASYEARFFGVHSAMPSGQARRLCPHAVFLPGDHELYAQASAAVFDLFRQYTPLVEPLSLDEAFLDVSGSVRLFGPGAAIGAQLRKRVLQEEGLACSVGVATTKFVAKLASKAAKPTPTQAGPQPGPGVFEVASGSELDFLHPLPVRELWGVGPKTGHRLAALGITTVADLAHCPLATLVSALGKANGTHLHHLSWARDSRRVEPNTATKSISHEETFAQDRSDRRQLEVTLVDQADSVASRLRAAELAGRTVTLKVRFGDFETITRSATQDRPFSSGPAIAQCAKALLADIDLERGVRLLGVAVANLGSDPGEQLSLLDLDAAGGAEAGGSELDGTVDEIRRRYGSNAIGPATSMPARNNPKTSKWGPDDN